MLISSKENMLFDIVLFLCIFNKETRKIKVIYIDKKTKKFKK